MAGLDANVVIRFFIEDNPKQFQSAVRLLESFTSESPGYISLVCLAEFVWVARARYAIPKAQLIVWISRMLLAPELVFEDESVVAETIRRFAESKSDFSDCLIACCCRAAGCESAVTFDRKASSAAGMSVLPT